MIIWKKRRRTNLRKKLYYSVVLHPCSEGSRADRQHPEQTTMWRKRGREKMDEYKLKVNFPLHLVAAFICVYHYITTTKWLWLWLLLLLWYAIEPHTLNTLLFIIGHFLLASSLHAKRRRKKIAKMYYVTISIVTIESSGMHMNCYSSWRGKVEQYDNQP